MFGYVRPFKPEMLVKEFELYKSVYCGLCRQLGSDYSIFARSILSYDCTFLALVCAGLGNEKLSFNVSHKRCTCNPLKKCSYCSSVNNSLELAAAFSVISFYYKLKDTVRDENLFKGFFARLLMLLTSRVHKKAMKNYTQIDTIVSDMLEKQFAAEEFENCSVDRAAHPTAVMLSELMKTLSDSEAEELVYSQFGYFLGRWVYIIDAADDFDKDKSKKSFNPIVNKFPGSSMNDKEVQSYCNGLLNQTMAQLIAAYNLMEIKRFSSIIDHIIKVGMPEMQRKVIFDRTDNRKNSEI